MNKELSPFEGQPHYSTTEFTVVETIERAIRSEMIGNFNPFFCDYNGRRELLHSDAGDLSDPFRREQSYAESLFIVPKE